VTLVSPLRGPWAGEIPVIFTFGAPFAKKCGLPSSISSSSSEGAPALIPSGRGAASAFTKKN